MARKSRKIKLLTLRVHPSLRVDCKREVAFPRGFPTSKAVWNDSNGLYAGGDPAAAGGADPWRMSMKDNAPIRSAATIQAGKTSSMLTRELKANDHTSIPRQRPAVILRVRRMPLERPPPRDAMKKAAIAAPK